MVSTPIDGCRRSQARRLGAAAARATGLGTSKLQRTIARTLASMATAALVWSCAPEDPSPASTDAVTAAEVGCGRGADGVLRRCPDGEVCLVESGTCAPVVADCKDGWCLIPASSFLMFLRPDTEEDSFIPRWTTVSRSFVMMQTEVTQELWFDTRPLFDPVQRFRGCGPDCPMETMSYGDMLRFANALSARDGLDPCYEVSECAPQQGSCIDAIFAGPDCRGYRLPSLAEWQLAASVGFPWRCLPDVADIDLGADACGSVPAQRFAVSIGNSEASYEGCVDCTEGASAPCAHSCCGPRPVASLTPNAHGLYDLIGNLIEVTGTVLKTNVTDGPPYPGTSLPPLSDSARDRAPGGDWVNPGYDTTLSTRVPVAFAGGAFRQFPDQMCWSAHSAVAMFLSSPNVGLRLVRTLPTEELSQ